VRLPDEDNPDLPEPDVGRQPLKPEPVLGGACRLSLVFIDNIHCLWRPSEIECALAQIVLALGACAVVRNLEVSGLANVDARPAREMVWLDFSVSCGDGGNPSPLGEEKVLSVVACDGTG
jgi:hypothetical protein